MARHRVDLRLNTNLVEIAHKDVEVVVHEGDSKLGTLMISKGNIEWRPTKKSIKKHRFSWSRFADLMESEGKAVRGPTR